MMSRKGAALVLLALASLAAVVVVEVVESSQKCPLSVLKKSFAKLSDYLESKLDANEAHLEAILALLDNYRRHLFHNNLQAAAVDLLKTIVYSNECGPSLFEAIQSVAEASPAAAAAAADNKSPAQQALKRGDQMVRLVVGTALNRCDSYHERALVEAVAKLEWPASFEATDISNLIGSHEPAQLSFHDDRAHSGWDFKNYTSAMIDACDQLHVHVDPVMSYGQLASSFHANYEQEFLAKRSARYNRWLLRRMFCHELNSALALPRKFKSIQVTPYYVAHMKKYI